MKAKDTVLSNGKLLVMLGTPNFTEMEGREKQAEITWDIAYKAGYEEGRLYGKQESLLNQAIIDQQVQDAKQAGLKEVVEWIEGFVYKEITFDPDVKAYYISGKVWQAKLREWGIK